MRGCAEGWRQAGEAAQWWLSMRVKQDHVGAVAVLRLCSQSTLAGGWLAQVSQPTALPTRAQAVL